MAKVRVIEVHENVFNTNNLAANELRERLSKKKVTMLNVMSSQVLEKQPFFQMSSIESKINIK